MTFEIQAHYDPRVLTALRADEQATISTELVTVKALGLKRRSRRSRTQCRTRTSLLFIRDL